MSCCGTRWVDGFEAAPGARFVLQRIEAEQPPVEETLLADMPISIYGGG